MVGCIISFDSRVEEEKLSKISTRIKEFVDSEEVINIIRGIVGFERNGKYLVGGVVRDILLSRKIVDVDFIITGKNGKFFINEISKRLKRRYALLENKEDETYRILYGDKTYDFTLVDDEEFEENIKSRDFTINSIAYEFEKDKLVDIVGGVKDLEEKIIRVTSRNSISRDPLRILRGIRFLVHLTDFTLHDDTSELFSLHSSELREIAPERIRDELLKIMSGDRSELIFQSFGRYSIYRFVFGRGYSEIDEKFYDTIGSYKGRVRENFEKFGKNQKILICFSGGTDSCCLSYVLKKK